MLNTAGHVYLGGLPDLTKMTSGHHKHNFVGCIADVKINGRLLDLSADALDGRAVRPCQQWIQSKAYVYSKKPVD
uniref:LAM_G_DOMAIN domain-containing protein n=1 Tax=Syphacia muris TaxID=451379 RepID=A0A0N5A7P0_9BILA